MNKDKILEILKKNLLSILCGVVAIAAVVVAFWPVGGMFSKLKEESDTRANVYGTITGLLNKPRLLPLTDPSKTTQDTLPQFPNEKTIEVGKAATAAVSQQSAAMYAAVVQLDKTLHPLLDSEVLPNPLSESPRFIFLDRYKAVFDPDKSAKTDPTLQAAKVLNLKNDILNGCVPPTDLEITAAKANMYQNDYAPQIIYTNGTPVNQEDVMASYHKAEFLLPDQLRTQRASEHKMYVATDAFTVNNNFGRNAPDLVDIWNAQVALWIEQDVCNALAEANANAKNILDAPVKHLLKLTVPLTFVSSTATAVVPGAPGVPVEGGDVSVIAKNYGASATGRASNSMYDLVQFTMVINVDASQAPMVIATLSKNRLIDVYNVDVLSVDSPTERLKGFLYGTAPIVQLNLKCEALFMRIWTAGVMPDKVLQALGINRPVPPGSTPAVPATPQASIQ